MRAQQSDLLFFGRRGHHRRHRVVQGIKCRKRPLLPRALGHPRRLLEDPPERGNESVPIVLVELFQSHDWNTISPSTRTSRTLSEPASVNNTASACAGASARCTAASSTLPAAGLRYTKSAALPARKSPISFWRPSASAPARVDKYSNRAASSAFGSGASRCIKYA